VGIRGFTMSNRVRTVPCLVCVVGALAASAAGRDAIVMPDSTSDVVQRFDAFDGTFLGTVATLNQPGGALTPVEALVVGNAVWVSDQLQDNITAYDLATGAYLGVIVGPEQGLDNVRGIEVVAGRLWVTCGSGIYAGQVVVFDQFTRAFLFAVDVGGSPFDAVLFEGVILVPNSDSGDIDRVALDGTILSKFVDSTGPDQPLDFPEQVYPDRRAGDVLVAEFSGTRELFRFGVDGTLLESIDTTPQGGVRGILRLGNGKIMFSNGNGVHTYDAGEGVRTLYAGGGRYLTLVRDGGFCAPDFNSDGFLDFFDYADFVACFEGAACPPGRTADYNNDAFVDLFDYNAYVAAFEDGC
jgi:hypothetical protein